MSGLPAGIGGQSSGDFHENSSRVVPLYTVTRNSLGSLTTDAYTQANPGVVTVGANKSTTLSAVTQLGVLSGSVAFSRPDVGNGFVGGPVAPGGVYNAKLAPLGIFINDSRGNGYENLPGIASGKGPYFTGAGTSLLLSIYETQQQIGGNAALVWSAGDKVFASVNGLLTNRLEDAYEYNVAGQNSRPFCTVMGVVKSAPDVSTGLMIVDLRV